MEKINYPPPAKLVLAMFSNNLELFRTLPEKLINLWGEIDFESPLFNFDHTSHYEKEMGSDLKKKFVSFEKLIPQEELVEIKLATNSLEQEYLSKEGGRAINLDPGYITAAKLVLASTKNYSHRIYLGKGIYGEVTLFFKQDSFQAHPWTYPDYQSEEAKSAFTQIREIYKEQVRAVDS